MRYVSLRLLVPVGLAVGTVVVLLDVVAPLRRDKSESAQAGTGMRILGMVAIEYVRENSRPPAAVDDLINAGFLRGTEYGYFVAVDHYGEFLGPVPAKVIREVTFAFPESVKQCKLADGVVVSRDSCEEVAPLRVDSVPPTVQKLINRYIARVWFEAAQEQQQGVRLPEGK